MRVRKIVIADTPEDRETFSLLYQGFVTGGNMPQQSKGMEVTRREARVLDKLEAVSDETGGEACVSCGTRIAIKREPKAGTQTIALEQPEFDLLKKYFEATPWTVRMSQRVVNISDWLASIPLEEGS